MNVPIRYQRCLTGVVSYRQTFWRRRMVLVVQEECTPLLPGLNKPDSTVPPHMEWRDATWADISNRHFTHALKP